MISELKWDTNFFGKKIGKLEIDSSKQDLKELLGEAVVRRYRYLTCRLGAERLKEAQNLASHGFYLTDIGTTWERATAGAKNPSIAARQGTPEDGGIVRHIAKGLLRDGRFYNDPFFSSEEADKLYQAWAENSVKGEAEKVLLIGEKGFVTCRILGSKGEIQLIMVAEGSRSQGIGTALVLNALQWFYEKGIGTVAVRTQASNNGAISLYQKLGFKLKEVDITMGIML